MFSQNSSFSISSHLEKCLHYRPITNVLSFIDTICQPDSLSFKNPLQRIHALQRNKRILLAKFTVLLSLLIYLLLINSPAEPLIETFSLILLILSSFAFLLTCRKHFSRFKVFYTITASLYSLCLIWFGRENLSFSLVAIHILPISVLFVTGSRSLLLYQVIWQLISLKLLTKPLVDYSLNTSLGTFDFLVNMVDASYITLVLNSLFFLLMFDSLSKSQKNQIILHNRNIQNLNKQKIFLLSFSHELRNLINSMTGCIQISLLEKLSPKVESMLRSSEVCAQLLLHLVNNILDSGKVQVGELEINPTSNLVSETFEKAWETCSELIKLKKLKGQFRMQTNIPTYIKLDHHRLTQMFINLVGNAIKFTNQGGVYVDVEWIGNTSTVTDHCFQPLPFDEDEEGVFEKRKAFAVLNKSTLVMNLDVKKIKRDNASPIIATEAGVLKIIVTDSGCGIPMSDMAGIFQRVHQLSEDLNEPRLRTGLGLFVTKELCTRMGGEIKVFSKEGKGSAFIMCIPVEPSDSNDLRSVNIETFQKIMKLTNSRALIVDDLDFNITVLQNYCGRLGIQVADIGKDGIEAVQKYKDIIKSGEKIDIVTMDVEMPGMNGKKAAELIREFEVENNMTPCLLIMISGNCSESEMNSCLNKTGKIRADSFLKKPISLHDLFRVVQTHFCSNKFYSKATVKMPDEKSP